MATAKVTDKIDINQLSKLLGVQSPDEVIDRYDESGDTYSVVYREAIRNGESESAAEREAEKAEREERDEYFAKAYDATMSVAERLFGEHNLELKPVGKGKRPFELKVIPQRSWRDSAQKIVETINGVGEFYFHSVKEFLSSGPYTEREAVLSHLHWIPTWPEVYGEGTARSMYDRAAR